MPKGNSGKQKKFKFGNAEHGSGQDKTHSLLNASLNVKITKKTPEGAMRAFQKIHGNSDHEFGATIDSQGFVHRYVEGNAHSVSIFSNNKDHLVLHNHPNGGAFSKNDMLSTAREKSRGIVASGKNYDYVFLKGSHFEKYSQAFQHAVKNSTLQGKDYDDAVHKWLTANQKKYHYKYYRKKN